MGSSIVIICLVVSGSCVSPVPPRRGTIHELWLVGRSAIDPQVPKMGQSFWTD